MPKFERATRLTQKRNSNHLRRKWLMRVKWCLIDARTWDQVWIAIVIKLRFVNLVEESWTRSRS